MTPFVIERFHVMARQHLLEHPYPSISACQANCFPTPSLQRFLHVHLLCDGISLWMNLEIEVLLFKYALLPLDGQACGNLHVCTDVGSLRVIQSQSIEDLFNLLFICPNQSPLCDVM